MCFDFLYTFCLKQFSLQEELSDIWSIMYTFVFMQSNRNSCQILIKLEFSPTDCRKTLKYQISLKSAWR